MDIAKSDALLSRSEELPRGRVALARSHALFDSQYAAVLSNYSVLIMLAGSDRKLSPLVHRSLVVERSRITSIHCSSNTIVMLPGKHTRK